LYFNSLNAGEVVDEGMKVWSVVWMEGYLYIVYIFFILFFGRTTQTSTNLHPHPLRISFVNIGATPGLRFTVYMVYCLHGLLVYKLRKHLDATEVCHIALRFTSYVSTYKILQVQKNSVLPDGPLMRLAKYLHNVVLRLQAHGLYAEARS
jgi:hypothetical protein